MEQGEKKPKPVSPATQLKRRKVVDGLMAGKQVQDALVEAGYSQSTATKAPGEILKGLQTAFAEALDKILPREVMVTTLVEGLGATKATYVYNPKLGETETFEQPDHFARVKSAELLGKLGGLIARKDEVKVTHGIDHASIIAARRRVGLLPQAEPDATVEAQPVPDEHTPIT